MRGLFGKRKDPFDGDGLVLFKTTAGALKAEKVLRAAGLDAKLVAPPLSRRRGCDLAVEVNLLETLAVERVLLDSAVRHEGLEVLSSESARLLELVQVVELGDFVMVKAGNMKMTCERRTGVIANVSGGGCPDIPYLFLELVGRVVTECARPRELGSTLCALLLDRAWEESARIVEDREDASRCRNGADPGSSPDLGQSQP